VQCKIVINVYSFQLFHS